MLIVALVLHTLIIGFITLVLIQNGWIIFAIIQYILTLFIVVALVRRPWRVRHGNLYLRHNVLFSRIIPMSDIVAVERRVSLSIKGKTTAQFDIALRDGSRRLFMKQPLGGVSMNDAKINSVTAWIPGSAIAMAQKMQIPYLDVAVLPSQIGQP